MKIHHTFKIGGIAAALVALAGVAWCADSGDNPVVGRWLVLRVGPRDATTLPFRIEREFTDDQVIVRDAANKQELSRNRYTLDLAKDPKWITVEVVDQVTELRAGIFRIVGDQLHIKQAVGGVARPLEFVKDGYSIMKRR